MYSHVEATSSFPSPIARLNGDILWLIFDLNADMFRPLEYDLEQQKSLPGQYALDTILAMSRLESLRMLGREGQEEVMKRTGTAPLYILGSVYVAKNFGREIFSPLLQLQNEHYVI
ncbi:hypothetical protein CPB84DRAFT_1828325 [Gymnopilus junonius]|uniref:Uncharacterized protein n=1 Tax=Gymnopilus junonius TaxID=109634 RepID=A0A9P5TIE4_GYMJU|nr:hypothetical protein CPB84DRAFT_1828325 [Gymnopilus junonius]